MRGLPDTARRRHPVAYWLGYWLMAIAVLATTAKFTWWIWQQPW